MVGRWVGGQEGRSIQVGGYNSKRSVRYGGASLWKTLNVKIPTEVYLEPMKLFEHGVLKMKESAEF